MVDARVVDTNVLYVASAADPASPFPADGTPVEKAEVRDRVLGWLQEFESDPDRHVVLDYHWRICEEYLRKDGRGGISEQDYGWLAIMRKRDYDQVLWVGFDVDQHEDAQLPHPLCVEITDRDDRKMVAGVLSALASGSTCRLAVACDTDWIDFESSLKAAGIDTEYLIEEWLRAKWLAKKTAA